jgi:cytochrome c oxidase assembly protein subunit 17
MKEVGFCLSSMPFARGSLLRCHGCSLSQVVSMGPPHARPVPCSLERVKLGLAASSQHPAILQGSTFRGSFQPCVKFAHPPHTQFAHPRSTTTTTQALMGWSLPSLWGSHKPSEPSTAAVVAAGAPIGPDGKPKKICCTCPDTKKLRDACIAERGACQSHASASSGCSSSDAAHMQGKSTSTARPSLQHTRHACVWRASRLVGGCWW